MLWKEYVVKIPFCIITEQTCPFSRYLLAMLIMLRRYVKKKLSHMKYEAQAEFEATVVIQLL